MADRFFVAAVAALFGVVVTLPVNAHVHQSSDGTTVSWYPKDCCHDRDCRPAVHVVSIERGFLMTTEEGVTVFVPSNHSRRPSLDSRWHVCIAPGEYTEIFCVFEPPTS